MSALHIGNVTEFNEPSLSSTLSQEVRQARIHGCDEYASMAPFYGSDPGIVVVPARAQEDLDVWAELQAGLLNWQSFEPIAWTWDSSQMSSGLDALPAVESALAADVEVLPWGETPEFRELITRHHARAASSSSANVVRDLDSKLNHHALFEEAQRALGSPDWLTVPEEHVAGSETELVDILVNFGGSGTSAIVKSPVGVGGSGAVVLRASSISSTTRARTAIATSRSNDNFIGETPLIVQAWHRPNSSIGDLTTDFEIRTDSIERRGSAWMLLDGTHYRGAVTVTRGEDWIANVEAFGAVVAEEVRSKGFRGWFDIDFVVSAATGCLVPVEINARRTGPTVAFSIRERLRQITGRPLEVAIHDMITIPSQMDSQDAVRFFVRCVQRIGLEGKAIPTLTTATSAGVPYLGAAVSGDSAAQAFESLTSLAHVLSTTVA